MPFLYIINGDEEKDRDYRLCEIEIKGFSSQEGQVLGFPQVLLFCSVSLHLI